MSRNYSVAVIAGDGIGHEVVPAATDVVDALGARHGFSVDWTPYPWGSDHYRAHGTMMPADGLDQLARHEAVFFGAVGAPDIADHIRALHAEGRREVWLRIQQHLQLSDEQLWTLFAASQPARKASDE